MYFCLSLLVAIVATALYVVYAVLAGLSTLMTMLPYMGFAKRGVFRFIRSMRWIPNLLERSFQMMTYKR